MTRFEQFIKERRSLGYVSERTIEWYERAFKWLPNEDPTESELKHRLRFHVLAHGLRTDSANGCNGAVDQQLRPDGSSHV